MSGWKFGTVPLLVLRTPRPGRSAGYRRIGFEAPGVDGITATIPDGRLPTYLSLTVQARSDDELESLSALLESGTEGDLEVPHGSDSWVYEDAYVDGRVQWQKGPGGLWEGRVDFICPKPRPLWLSSRELVY